MDWQSRAKLLPFGGKRKIKHCGTDNSAYIRNSAKGISIKCHRCGDYSFERHGKLSSKDFLRMRDADYRLRRGREASSVPLYGEDVPAHARQWLLKAGISPEAAWKEYSIGFDAESGRVLIPISHDGRGTGPYIGRATDGRRPKYVLPAGSESLCWYWLKEPGPVIVVEDILSAIKCKEAGYSSLAALGTTVPTTVAAILADREVLGWFDPDAAGRKGWVGLRRALAPYGVRPKRLKSEKDPKYYTRDEIHNIVKDAK